MSHLPGNVDQGDRPDILISWYPGGRPGILAVALVHWRNYYPKE